MKIRTCFVSNSSSSSYVCLICGEEASGMDLCLSDAGMFECENGHVICENDAVDDFSKWTDEYDKLEAEGKSSGDGYHYEVPERYCPICSMLEFSQADLKAYLKKKSGIPEDEVFDTVKAANKRRKKLYDNEYVMYVLTKTGLRMDDLVREIKEKFPTYKEFKKACK